MLFSKKTPEEKMEKLVHRKAWGELSEYMFNFNNKKNKQIFSAIIIIILVLAMVVPMVASALLY